MFEKIWRKVSIPDRSRGWGTKTRMSPAAGMPAEGRYLFPWLFVREAKYDAR
jgi:hypothetical protein